MEAQKETILNPYIQDLQKQIVTRERLCECYELRLQLIRKDYASKNEYEKNEVDILEIKTMFALEKQREILNELRADLDEMYEQVMQQLSDEKDSDSNTD